MIMSHGRSKVASQRAHEAMVRDSEGSRNLAFDGVQTGTKGQVFLMLRCPCCGSTLYQITTLAEALQRLADQVGVLHRSQQVLAESVSIGQGPTA